MRKIFKLLTLGLFLFSSAVNAQSIDEAKKVNEEIIKNHNFEYKYVNPDKMIDKNYKWFQKNDYDGSTYSKERITHNFYEYMFREDLYNIVDFENVAGIDTACYFKGETRYNKQNKPETVTNDSCEAMIYYGELGNFEDEQLFEIEVRFNEVNGDEKISQKVDKITDDLFGTFHVADKDMINHLVNYESDTSTFFSNKRAVKEFSKLKNIVEKNPDFDITVSFEETRRGIAYTGIADGLTYVKKDGVYYGFTYNGFFQSNMYYVPVGTPLEDYGKVLEDKLIKYINNDDVKIKVTLSDNLEDYNGAQGVEEILNYTMGLKVNEYYKLVNTNFDKEFETLKKYQLSKNYYEYYTEDAGLITGVPYKLSINDKDYYVAVLQMPEKYMESVGIISTVDTKTGIILKTKASNVPLDANLISDKYDLTSEEIKLLEKNGYKKIDSYSLKLYSSILDKIISNFNDVTNVLIPYDGETKDLVVLYIKDDGTFEKYDAQIVTIEGIKYLSFNTNHFSNYIIASNNVVNPNTLDNIGLYFGIMALSLGVIVILVIKSNKKLKR